MPESCATAVSITATDLDTVIGICFLADVNFTGVLSPTAEETSGVDFRLQESPAYPFEPTVSSDLKRKILPM